MELFFILLPFGVLLLVFMAISIVNGLSTDDFDYKIPELNFISRPDSYSDTLKELKAKEELEKDYEFVMPDYYGTYFGEKMYEPTPEMLSDINFFRAQGKWIKKK